MDYSITFSEDELVYLLVGLTEGRDIIQTKHKKFKGFQDTKVWDPLTDKIRQKCWEMGKDRIGNRINEILNDHE